MNPKFRYNHSVTECEVCGEVLWPLTRDFVAVDVAPWRSTGGDEYAVLYECPRCGSKWWCHITEFQYQEYRKEKAELTSP